ncbi:ribonuclease VapC [Methanobacterium alkalithermotolerans]|uniref:Ribonuclease VapC n=1 Tax=Methanobacterium alkalithermotolerans TaxID=2731220 RepID=A0A8T8K5N7_9EURY|nr:ribonuclease VapC [Methanobacterium alkalithermotolerans]QUH23854.1 ribonuclease VapC [Methanobacterium alkalithermotolerans]
MFKKNLVLDASAFIGGYVPEKECNFTVSEITDEVKDLKSLMIMERAIKEGNLIIDQPDEEDVLKVESSIKNSGDNLRLSNPDKKILALALSIKKRKGNVNVITDDYSIQNALKILGIPFRSILTPGISEVYNWKKICRGCKKKFSENYLEDECDICGSPIHKKRFKSSKMKKKS